MKTENTATDLNRNLNKPHAQKGIAFKATNSINMNKIKQNEKIKFSPITLDDKTTYEDYFYKEERIIGECERGCEFSFANLYLWGRQNMAKLRGHLLLLSQFDERFVYPYPLGAGDKKPVIDAIIEDSKARGIPCIITGLTPSARQTLEELYPESFSFQSNEGSYDYVYSINDLAELSGKKYHGKRNHLYRFKEAHPTYLAELLTEDNISKAEEMAEEWYEKRLSENPDADFHMEKAALKKAMRDFRELQMEGLAISENGKILAFTFASRLSEDTFDVHFEKAFSGIQGAYVAINYEFARYIRAKYPNVKFLDREEDMGIEGLRKAKRSYHPDRMIKKYKAYLTRTFADE